MGEQMSCFFCGRTIKPDDILFVDTEWSAKYEDDGKTKIFSSFLDYPVEPTYKGLYHPVVPENATYENGVPIELMVDRADGLTPAEVDRHLEEKHGEAKRAQSAQNEALYEDDYMEDTAPVAPMEIAEGRDRPADSEQKPESQPGFYLQGRACPYCRSSLPVGFGVMPVRHVVMAGGRASGKTTFLINALQQLNGQLADNNLGSVEMVPESDLYYTKLIDTYVARQGTMDSTTLDSKKGLCPLYFKFRGTGANRGKMCFFAIHDIAGEGFRPERSAYIRNHRGIRSAEAMLLIIDPHQLRHDFEDNPQSKAKDEAFAYYETINTFLNNSIQDHLSILQGIKRVVVVMTKMDVPLSAHGDMFDPERSILLRDIGKIHNGYVNLLAYEAIEKELLAYLKTQGISDIKKLIEEKFDDHVPDEIVMTAVSTYTMIYSGGKAVFVNRYQDTAPKHRIIEPILYLMASWGVLKAKRPQDAAPKREEKPRKRRLFRN